MPIERPGDLPSTLRRCDEHAQAIDKANRRATAKARERDRA